MSMAGLVFREVGTSVKGNKNQLCNYRYMKTGPDRDPSIAMLRCWDLSNVM